MKHEHMASYPIGTRVLIKHNGRYATVVRVHGDHGYSVCFGGSSDAYYAYQGNEISTPLTVASFDGRHNLHNLSAAQVSTLLNALLIYRSHSTKVDMSPEECQLLELFQSWNPDGATK